MSAIEKLTSDNKFLPRDLGGQSSTKDVTKAMIDILKKSDSLCKTFLKTILDEKAEVIIEVLLESKDSHT